MVNSQGGRDSYYAAVRLINERKLEEAIIKLTDHLKNYPKDSSAWFVKADALVDLKRCDEAVRCYDEAYNLGFTNITPQEFWFRKGACFGNAGRHKEAIQCYDQSLLIDKNYYDALNYKGVALYRLGEYEQSLNYFDRAIAVSSNYASAYKNKGNALSLLKRYSEAIVSYDQALEKNPEYAAAWANKGNALYGLSIDGPMERYEEAIDCYNKALRFSSGSHDRLLVATTYLNRGQSKYSLGKIPEALEDFIKIDHDDLSARKFNNIGLCYYQLGLFNDADKEFTLAIKANPKLVDAYYNLAVLFNAEGEHEKTKRFLNICLKLDRNFSKARNAIKKLSASDTLDWYAWWFTSAAQKKALGMGILVIIISLIISTAFISLVGPNFQIYSFKTPTLAPNVTALLIVMIGFLIVILLLPSLRKVKIGEVELETASFSPKLYVELDLSLPMTGQR